MSSTSEDSECTCAEQYAAAATCFLLVAVLFGFIPAIVVVADCKSDLHSDHNVDAVAVIVSAVRSDSFNCLAKLRFKTPNGNISAPSLIRCLDYAEGQEELLIGVELKVCYSHFDPTGEALVKTPEKFVPTEYKHEHCAVTSYNAAMRCQRSFWGVLLGLIASVLGIPFLWLSIGFYYKCTASLERRRLVSPDNTDKTADLEMMMAPEHV